MANVQGRAVVVSFYLVVVGNQTCDGGLACQEY